MSPLRPDIVAVWIFRRHDEALELLLLRRAPGHFLEGMWQCVTGSIETGERVAAAALREVREETGLGPDDIETFYELDMVNSFYEPKADAVLAEAVFALRVRSTVRPVISSEHDDLRWVTPEQARGLLVWPAWRAAVARIEEDLADAARAAWFELLEDGSTRRR